MVDIQFFGKLLLRLNIENDVGYTAVILNRSTVCFQIFDHGKDEGVVLIVFCKLERFEVGKAAYMVDEALNVQFHFKGGVPFLKGEHGLPVQPEV